MSNYTYQHFNVTFPPEHQYVAHVEINRPDKLNAFIEACAFLPFSSLSSRQFNLT